MPDSYTVATHDDDFYYDVTLEELISAHWEGDKPAGRLLLVLVQQGVLSLDALEDVLDVRRIVENKDD